MSINNKSPARAFDTAFYVYCHRLAEVLARNRKFIKLIENGYKVENVKFLYGLELDDLSLRITQRYALVVIAKDNELKSIFIDTINGKTLEIFNVKKPR